jgi:hypothetical protein
MSLEWKPLLRTALSEQDPTARAAACEQARHEINSRLLELAGQDADATRDERSELEEALRQLTMHEWKKD